MAGQAITSINTSFDPINTNQEIKIKIFLDKPEIIRHELCHVNQFVENRSYSCSFIFGVYKNELECYHKTSSENLTEKEQEEYLRYLA